MEKGIKTLHMGATKMAPSQNCGSFLCKRSATAPPMDSPIKNLILFLYSAFSAVSKNKEKKDNFIRKHIHQATNWPRQGLKKHVQRNNLSGREQIDMKIEREKEEEETNQKLWRNVANNRRWLCQNSWQDQEPLLIFHVLRNQSQTSQNPLAKVLFPCLQSEKKSAENLHQPNQLPSKTGKVKTNERSEGYCVITVHGDAAFHGVAMAHEDQSFRTPISRKPSACKELHPSWI